MLPSSAVEPSGGLTCFSTPLTFNAAEIAKQKSLWICVVLQTQAAR